MKVLCLLDPNQSTPANFLMRILALFTIVERVESKNRIDVSLDSVHRHSLRPSTAIHSCVFVRPPYNEGPVCSVPLFYLESNTSKVLVRLIQMLNSTLWVVVCMRCWGSMIKCQHLTTSECEQTGQPYCFCSVSQLSSTLFTGAAGSQFEKAVIN